MESHETQSTPQARAGAVPTTAVWVGAWLFMLFAAGGALVDPAARAGSARSNASFGHFGRHGSGEIDPASARQHAELAAEWVLRWVDASDGQRAQVLAIASGAAEELVGLAERHRGRRAEFARLLAAPQIDRAALEGLRASELETLDAASRRLVDALADVAEVLTPEQRAELLALADRMHH